MNTFTPELRQLVLDDLERDQTTVVEDRELGRYRYTFSNNIWFVERQAGRGDRLTTTREAVERVLEHDPSQWHQQLRSTLWKMLGTASIARDLKQVERLTGLIDQYNLDNSAHGLFTITWRAIMFWPAVQPNPQLMGTITTLVAEGHMSTLVESVVSPFRHLRPGIERVSPVFGAFALWWMSQIEDMLGSIPGVYVEAVSAYIWLGQSAQAVQACQKELQSAPAHTPAHQRAQDMLLQLKGS